MARELKVVGKDASIAPSTLEKGVAEHKPQRTRRRTEKSPISRTQIHPAVWEVVGPRVKQGLFIYVEDSWCVWVLNQPADDIDWLGPR